MNRRQSVRLAAASLFAMQGPAKAQTAERIYRVGILRPSAPPLPSDNTAKLIPDALRELGYAEGRNLAIERRYANGQAERLPALAQELAQSRLDVIIAVSAPAVLAARAAAGGVPVVMYGNFDPVALKIVDSLARPGGNTTGVLIAPDGTLAGKRLELLKAAVPLARRFAHLLPPADAASRLQADEAKKSASALGIELVQVELRDGGYQNAFATIAARRPDALLVGSSTLFLRDRVEIVRLAAKYRLPATYEWREQVEDGGLMAYSTSLAAMYRRLADYVDRILKGAKPGDMPVERPTKFELVINLKTARELGLTIPQSLLLRADEVIQ